MNRDRTLGFYIITMFLLFVIGNIEFHSIVILVYMFPAFLKLIDNKLGVFDEYIKAIPYLIFLFIVILRSKGVW